jgi:large subunit ribosomal protein L26e
MLASVSSSRRTSRKAHFGASSEARRIIMSAPLSKELREKYSTRATPIRKGDEVKIVRGSAKDTVGKVNKVYRKKFVIYVDSVKTAKSSGQEVQVPIHPSNVQITKLEMTASREAILARK